MDCKLRAKNCGGCPLLGLDYAAQLKQKEEKVCALVGKYGPVHPIRGMEQPYHYRNKVISTFAVGWGGKLTSGIYAANSHKVLPVESCLLQDEVLDKTMQAVRAAANVCRYQPYDEDKGTGLVRHCLLRRGVATGQVMVVLVTAQPVLPGAKNFVKALLAEAAQRGVTVTTVVQNVNSRKTSVVLGEAEKVLYGKGFILDTLCGKTYAISPRSFYQVNPAQTAVLYGLAVEAAKLTGKEVVLDAYCGIGTIGLTAADHAKQVVGVELNRDAVQDAMLKIICHLDKIREIPKREIPFYLIAITQTTCIDRYRKIQREKQACVMGYEDDGAKDFSDPKTPEKVFIHTDQIKLLNCCLKELPQREIDLLYYFYTMELSGKEIARLMGMTENAIRMALTRARRKVLFAYRKKGGDDYE